MPFKMGFMFNFGKLNPICTGLFYNLSVPRGGAHRPTATFDEKSQLKIEKIRKNQLVLKAIISMKC